MNLNNANDHIHNHSFDADIDRFAGGQDMNTTDIEVIQQWLVTCLAAQLDIAPQEIDVCRPITEYGLDSIAAISLAGDLEDWLGLELSPTLLWDYPVIEILARYLAAALTADAKVPEAPGPTTGVATAGMVVDRAQAEQFLTHLDDLSDTAVDAMLHDLLAA